MTKKNIIIIFVILILILIGFGINRYIYRTRLLIKNPNDVVNFNVYYKDKDVTQEIPTKEIILILEELVCKKSSYNPFPRTRSDIVFEIDYLYKNKIQHVILGELNYVYESANKKGYLILNSDGAIERLEAILKNQE